MGFAIYVYVLLCCVIGSISVFLYVFSDVCLYVFLYVWCFMYLSVQFIRSSVVSCLFPLFRQLLMYGFFVLVVCIAFLMELFIAFVMFYVMSLVCPFFSELCLQLVMYVFMSFWFRFLMYLVSSCVRSFVMQFVRQFGVQFRQFCISLLLYVCCVSCFMYAWVYSFAVASFFHSLYLQLCLYCVMFVWWFRYCVSSLFSDFVMYGVRSSVRSFFSYLDISLSMYLVVSLFSQFVISIALCVISSVRYLLVQVFLYACIHCVISIVRQFVLQLVRPLCIQLWCGQFVVDVCMCPRCSFVLYFFSSVCLYLFVRFVL